MHEYKCQVERIKGSELSYERVIQQKKDNGPENRRTKCGRDPEIKEKEEKGLGARSLPLRQSQAH